MLKENMGMPLPCGFRQMAEGSKYADKKGKSSLKFFKLELLQILTSPLPAPIFFVYIWRRILNILKFASSSYTYYTLQSIVKPWNIVYFLQIFWACCVAISSLVIYATYDYVPWSKIPV